MPSGTTSGTDPHIIPADYVSSEPMHITITIKGIMYSDVQPVLSVTTDRRIYKGADSMSSHPDTHLHSTAEYKIKMIFDKQQEPVMESIASQLWELHPHFGINGYVELAAAYVQAIRCDDLETNYLNYPLVTIFNDWATEEEKSMLLAGILAYGGYDTALLCFPQQENHHAVGIKSSIPEKYPLTNGYAVIETRSIKKIGETNMHTQATVSKVGSGTKKYLEGTVITPQAS